MLFSRLAKTQLVAVLAILVGGATITTEAQVAQFRAAGSSIAGASQGPGGLKGGGGSYSGPKRQGAGVAPSRQSSVGGASNILFGGKSPKKTQLSMFERASRGLPLDDDELAQLTPEQRAAWESQRASAVLGVA